MTGKDLSTTKRNSIVQFLLESSTDGKPARGRIEEAITKFQASRRTISRLWAAAKKQKENNGCFNSISKKKHRPQRILAEIDLGQIQRLPFAKRSTIRSLAFSINKKKTTVGRWVSQGLIKSHTNAIKPALTASHKMQRLRFSLDALERDRNLNKLQFKTMYNTVHIDEKWFHITKSSQRYYLTPGEAEPHKTCQSKKYIGKVMFMCAVGRPIFHEDGSVLFDGKIGIFPFTEMVPAIRNSKNRASGTMVEKAIPSINMAVIKNNFINQIVPAIKLSWPEGASKLIYIQQDNARPHIKDSDPEFRVVANSDGFDIRIVNQPPNSPDMNINDLGWFRAISSLQQQSVCLNTSKLVTAVTESFHKLEASKLNKVFLTLQSCMLEIMKLKGQNSYKIPHTKKDAATRQSILPITLEAPSTLVRECIDHLIEQGAVEGIEGLIQELGLNQIAGA